MNERTTKLKGGKGLELLTGVQYGEVRGLGFADLEIRMDHYDEALKDLIKAQPGAYWHPPLKCWQINDVPQKMVEGRIFVEDEWTELFKAGYLSLNRRAVRILHDGFEKIKANGKEE